MTRRKSVCSKWTLVLFVVVLCQFVHSRPQDVSSTVSTPPTNNVQTTETTQRYRFRSNEQLARFKAPIVISFVNNSFYNTKSPGSKNETNFKLQYKIANTTFRFDTINKNTTRSSRKSRLVSSKNKSNDLRKKHDTVSSVIKNTRNKVKIANHKNNLKVSEPTPLKIKKPPIRKIVTKWRDKAKYEDLDFNLETTTSNENVSPFENSYVTDDSTDLNNDFSTEATEKGNKYQNLNKLYNKLVNNRYRPKPEYSEETQVYSSNVQIVDRYPFSSSRPTYVFTTPMPTPIITNVGNPQPWHRPSYPNVNRKTTKKPLQTKRPIKNQYDYQNAVHNNVQYPYHNFEVTTFPPSTAYTDRIVIRPEEYAASPDECPTIFLTLNNTFQGQGKEACPDLNIAVNTNVVNKNVVIESDEEETENLFPNAFGDIDDSEAESTQANDYFESEEDAEELGDSASIEGTELTNYNAANEEVLSDSPEAGGFGSPSTNLASLHKPSRPSSDLDDLFSFSGFVDFFRPSLSALSWLVSLNPFNFGLLSFFFSPVAMIFAAAYGIASFFSRLPFARAAPKVIHVSQPQWQWDDDVKAWQLNTFPTDREYKYRTPKNSNEENAIKPTLFFKLKEWMKTKTKELRENNLKKIIQTNRRSKRKKREAWTRRVK